MQARDAGGFAAWGSAPAPGGQRERHFPREAPESATVARPLGGADSARATGAGPLAQGGAHPGGPPPAVPAGAVGAVGAGQRQNGRSRVLALAGGGVALAVVAGVAVVALSHGGGQPDSTPSASAGQATQAGGAQNAIGPAAAAPGRPAITATRLSATKVRFSWKYDNPASGDTFGWRLTGTAGTSSGQEAKPELTVTVPSGKVACMEVRVTSAAGQASADSEPLCWPG
jgi:hypothetical protein